MPADPSMPAFDTEAIGRWGAPCPFSVQRERIAAYAAATNDGHPAHAHGDLAPPVFASLPAIGAAMEVPAVPHELLAHMIHGAHDLRFHRPLEPGMELATRAAALGIHGRPAGITVVFAAETRDERGELVAEQHVTAFVRGAEVAEPLGEPAPAHTFPAEARERSPLAEIRQRFDADQPTRYAAAVGDSRAIHVDEDAARAAGLPGIIVPRLCAMAFASQALIATVCPEDPARLERLAGRFGSLALPGQGVDTRLWRHAAGADRDVYVYEMISDVDAAVIRDGLAVVRRP